MGVKKIFTVLIIVVACILVGALVLNVLLPNVTAQLVNQVEDAIYKGTGLAFNFNGDTHVGGTSTAVTPINSGSVEGGVEGFTPDGNGN